MTFPCYFILFFATYGLYEDVERNNREIKIVAHLSNATLYTHAMAWTDTCDHGVVLLGRRGKGHVDWDAML